ncbi:MAG: hypothetical protein M3071_12095 [Actinomycetota bacterium]|nr:hypothetical protein [Actinomycetota bacterium]
MYQPLPIRSTQNTRGLVSAFDREEQAARTYGGDHGFPGGRPIKVTATVPHASRQLT